MNNTVKVKIGDQDFNVPFPNVGQLMDIESMKMAITNNKYSELALSGLKTNDFAASLADAIATFFVLIPQLNDKLKIRSYNDIDLNFGAEIVRAYLEDYYPFYKDRMKSVFEFQNKKAEGK